ncbi:M20 family peptidase [Clostridium bovifaecis]|uniref:Peptidase M20 domain-containing protein 2 n=1 Tax=Clostridium bovifaecis TaxID=2184719 RepID=A0A6I6EP41_9CLOT|nr:M20 family peptidase [Clostridium bovifaecis]
MKQEIIQYLASIEEDIFNISKYLYNYPEDSFCEHKAYEYLINILKNNNFKIEENYLDIPTAFMAQYGEGHPKICYICEYDCVCKKGHILGTNLVSAMSVGAALSLSKVIPKTGGSVVVVGCPGEFSGGSKVVMSRQGAFNDMDAVLMAQPNVINANCCTSPAVLPIKITYCCNKASGCSETNAYSAFDACLFTLNSINTIVKGCSKDCSIDRISINGDLDPYILTNNIESHFHIKAPTLNSAEEIKNKLIKIASGLKDLMNIDSEVSLIEVPYENFIANETLSRLFSHNLKEAGIIAIDEEIDLPYGLSLGSVSHLVPSLRYLINIVENDSIKYASEAFGKATLSPFAREQMMTAAKVLAFTGLDLIEQQILISEAKLSLHEYNKKH